MQRGAGNYTASIVEELAKLAGSSNDDDDEGGKDMVMIIRVMIMNFDSRSD